MPFEVGNPGGPGRPKGTPNKRTDELLEALAAAGMTPSDAPAVFLYRVYSGRQRFERYIDEYDDAGNPAGQVKVLEPASEGTRTQAAVACAKYVHPALKQVDVTSQGERLVGPLFPEDFARLMGTEPMATAPAALTRRREGREERPTPRRGSRQVGVAGNAARVT